MRREHSCGAPAPTRERLCALARAYPGALRELDRTPTHELETRLRVVARATERQAPAPVWASVLARYHGAWSLLIALRCRAGNEGVFRVDSACEDELRRHLAASCRGRARGEAVFALAGGPWGFAADRVRSLLDGRAQVDAITAA